MVGQTVHSGRHQRRKERVFQGVEMSAPEPMELDSLPVCDSGSPAAGAPKKKPEGCL